MATTFDRGRPLAPHPLHGILLAFPVAFFVGAVMSDLAYWSSYQVQWTNFSSWLIAGGLFFGGFALLWALIHAARARRRRPAILYFVLLLAMWLTGLFNALIHAKDGWAAMPAGLLLSMIVAVLALVAGWIGYSGRPWEAR